MLKFQLFSLMNQQGNFDTFRKDGSKSTKLLSPLKEMVKENADF